jgi:hypothetical protein
VTQLALPHPEVVARQDVADHLVGGRKGGEEWERRGWVMDSELPSFFKTKDISSEAEPIKIDTRYGAQFVGQIRTCIGTSPCPLSSFDCHIEIVTQRHDRVSPLIDQN